MTDYSELKRLAEACNPSWVVDTWWASCDDDNEAFAYGPLRECWPDAAEAKADMRFIAAANPATILALIAENERLLNREKVQTYRSLKQGSLSRMAAERDLLKAEVEALRANASLISLLPELDEALEDLQIHGQHSDQGYRKLKDWYRKIALACKAIDAAMTKEQR